MKPMDRNRRGLLHLLATLCTLIAMGALAPLAQAVATSGARAVQPSYDGGAIRLIGGGGYFASGRHVQIQVTVCLQKRSGSSFIDVRCATQTDTDNRVRARVSVPGCVTGVWRTTAYGQAMGRNGIPKLQAYDASVAYRCR